MLYMYDVYCIIVYNTSNACTITYINHKLKQSKTLFRSFAVGYSFESHTAFSLSFYLFININYVDESIFSLLGCDVSGTIGVPSRCNFSISSLVERLKNPS